ncbi:MAG: HigA family addiction module antitoxin [Planctomycetota bacterium]
MAQRINPEAFPPGEYIREELETRGWTQLDLAAILGRPATVVNEVIAGARSITPETAQGLADAFGTSAQLWMNLESSYQLAKVASRGNTVARRAKLYEIAPVREMQRRGWIEESSSIEVLESQVLRFFEIQSLDGPIRFQHSARKSTDYESVTPSQLAWLYRVRKLAMTVPVATRFSTRSFDGVLGKLAPLRPEPEEVRHIPKLLAQGGIRFLIVEHLPHTKIDGVCFWLDQRSPVVALSLRYDRIDWFWHTLIHEMAHVKNRDGVDQFAVDTSLVGSDAQAFEEKPAEEKNADLFAVGFLVDQAQLEDFIARVHPLYSKEKIAAFAKRIGVHPGMVVGQLQRRRKISYAHCREMLVKVRDIITSMALTDGWGHMTSL